VIGGNRISLAIGLFCAASMGLMAADEGEGSAVRPLDPALLFTGSVTATGWLASIEGYLQTPSGGQPGSSSPRRPETDEIGLDGLRVLPRVDARAAVRGHELHLAYTGLRIDGHATLTDELVSQGIDFPAGSPVKSELDLPLFLAGYRADWLIPPLGPLSLSPEIGLAFSPFRYTLASPAVGSGVDRAYTIAFPYLGLLLTAPIGERLILELDLAGSAGVAGAYYQETDLRLAFTVFRWRRLCGDLVLGLEGLWLNRKDSQSMPNDLNLRAGSFSTDPWAGMTFGIRMSF
jgi:hypothetical protein